MVKAFIYTTSAANFSGDINPARIQQGLDNVISDEVYYQIQAIDHAA